MLLGLGAARLAQRQEQRQIIAELQQPGVIIQLAFFKRLALLQRPVDTGPAVRFTLQILCQLRAFLPDTSINRSKCELHSSAPYGVCASISSMPRL